MDDLYASLTPIFQDVFDADALVVTPDLAPANLPQWDSLAHIRLVVAIERAFGLQLDSTEIAPPPNAAALVGIIRSHLCRRGA